MEAKLDWRNPAQALLKGKTIHVLGSEDFAIFVFMGLADGASTPLISLYWASNLEISSRAKREHEKRGNIRAQWPTGQCECTLGW